MKPTLKTVYIPTSDDITLQVGRVDNSDYYKSFDKDYNVYEEKLIIFTSEEYNLHIQEVIKIALEKAAEKAD